MMTRLFSHRRCQLRVAVAFASGLLVSLSIASWASFRYEGAPPANGQDWDQGSTVYLQNPADRGAPPVLQKLLAAGAGPGLQQRGAGIAWPCHGSDQGPLDTLLYRLLPSGWKLYVKPGTVLTLPAQYACHGNPWTTEVDQMLRSQDMTGTLWWGYDVLAIAPAQQQIASDPMPAGKIQPGGPMIPAPADSIGQKTDPLAVSTVLHGRKPLPEDAACAQAKRPAKITAAREKAITAAPGTEEVQDAPLSIGRGGKIVAAGWAEHVIPLSKAIHEHWRLALPAHPTARQARLGKLWMDNGGVLFQPLPSGKS